MPNGLTHVRMQEALRDAGFNLEYDVERRRFLPPHWSGTVVVLGEQHTCCPGLRSGFDPHHAIHVVSPRRWSVADSGH